MFFDPDGNGIEIVGWVRDLHHPEGCGLLAADFIWQVNYNDYFFMSAVNAS